MPSAITKAGACQPSCDQRSSRQARSALGAMACLVVGAIGSAACTTPYRSPVLRPSTAGFAGIDSAFGPGDGAAPEVDVLLVHGMGTHDQSWVQSDVSVLVRALGFSWDGNLPPPQTLENGASLYGVNLQQGPRALRVAAVLWSPITSPAKATLCYDVNEVTPLCSNKAAFDTDKRARANGYLKSQIMDELLSDVAFYLNEDGGRLIREAVQDAVLRSLSVEGMTLSQVRAGATPTAKANVPLFIVSESLGSKIVVDALQAFESSERTAVFAQQTRANVRALFLLANQIPILNLGVRSTTGQPDSYRHLKEFARARTATRQSTDASTIPLHVVAFSDPNDVLSYQLVSDAIPPEDAIISNVVVSNDCTVLGIYENPDVAHTGYLGTKPVETAIAHGSTAMAATRASGCARSSP
jgi:hypothetical protein